jgi:hypothetical protein
MTRLPATWQAISTNLLHWSSSLPEWLPAIQKVMIVLHHEFYAVREVNDLFQYLQVAERYFTTWLLGFFPPAIDTT